MLSITELKPGVVFKFEENPYVVTSSEHSKHGRGGAIMRTKIKNLFTGAIIDRTFKGSDNFEEIDLERKKAQFLYKEDESYFFMDSTSFEQFSLTGLQVGENKNFLTESLEIETIYYDNKPINIILPIKLNLTVTYTEPGFKGNSASATTKPATLETGAEVQVPLFIKIDDIVTVDTRDGSYVERA